MIGWFGLHEADILNEGKTVHIVLTNQLIPDFI
jgi:hypothetical protein